MPAHTLRRLDKAGKLSLADEKIVHAMIVGDGFVTKKGNVCFKHSMVQKDYALWKKMMLVEIGMKFQKDHIQAPSGFGRNPTIQVSTTSSSYGKRLRQVFYPDGRKRIPRDVFLSFGWREWAILFQDDGRCNRSSHYNTVVDGQRVRVECEPFANRYEFCFPTMSDEEMDAAMESLANLGVESRIGHHRKLGQRLLWITRAEPKRIFHKNISKILCESMGYKMSSAPTLKDTISRS